MSDRLQWRHQMSQAQIHINPILETFSLMLHGYANIFLNVKKEKLLRKIKKKKTINWKKEIPEINTDMVSATRATLWLRYFMF